MNPEKNGIGISKKAVRVLKFIILEYGLDTQDARILWGLWVIEGVMRYVFEEETGIDGAGDGE